jgi:hypothetical protein
LKLVGGGECGSKTLKRRFGHACAGGTSRAECGSGLVEALAESAYRFFPGVPRAMTEIAVFRSFRDQEISSASQRGEKELD